MPGVAYDPNSRAQAAFLGALSLSEVGNDPGGLYRGTGGADLSGAPVDEYGFPQWHGVGNSHAAGLFQFQPGTWSSYAKTYDLNFQDAADQKRAAWYLAQDTYRQETGRELTDALAAGDYQSVETALGKSTWLGARGKLAAYLAGGRSAQLPNDAAGTGEDTRATGSSSSAMDQVGDTLKRLFVPGYDKAHPKGGQATGLDGIVPRVGVFILGALLLIVAVWWLLSSAGVVPSAGSVAKTAAKVAAVAA